MRDEEKIVGGCQCGALRYEISGEPMLVAKCHCVNCQKSTGSGHLMGAAFGEDNIKISGETRRYSYTADSGGKVTSEFCPTCGTTTHSRSSNYPGMVIFRLGTIDGDVSVTPNFQVFQEHRRSWDKEWSDVPGFDAMPPLGGQG